MESNKFCVRINKNKVEVRNAAKTPPNKAKVKLTGNIVHGKEDGSFKFVSERHSIFDSSFSEFAAKILSMGLKQSDTTVIFQQCEKLLSSFGDMCMKSIQNSQMVDEKKAACDVISNASKYVSKKFENYKSTYLIQKTLSSDELYVAGRTRSENNCNQMENHPKQKDGYTKPHDHRSNI